MLRRFILGLMLLAALGGPAWADLIQDPLHQATSEGRKLYDAGQPNQAMAAFGQGRATDPGHPVLAFDVGVSLLALNKPDQAIEELRKALRTDDPQLKARTFYNLGNAYLQKNELPKAVESYRESLLLRADQKDAKRNLELALRRQQQQQQQQQQSKDGQQKNQQDQKQQQDQNQQGQRQEQQQKGQQQEQNQAQQQQQKQGQQGKQSQAEQKQQKGQPQTQPDHGQAARAQQRQAQPGQEDKNRQDGRKMDPAQAKQLLQALQSQEKAQLLQLLQSQRKIRKKEGRDW